MAATSVKWYGQNTDIEDRKRAEHLLTGEKRLLEMVALGDELPNVLHALCAFVNEVSVGCRHESVVLRLDRTIKGIIEPSCGVGTPSR